jgi:ABC-type antimicrobial peptide transport system permease subunit
MIYSLGCFVALIVILSAMRTRLVFEISGISLLLFGRTSPGTKLYSVIFLPGTIIHELSHWIVAEVLQVKTGEITILPSDSPEEDTQRLGSVATQKTDPFRGFLIGLAPFLSGITILVILGRLISDGWGIYPWWQLALIVYGIIVVGNSMMISRADRQSWPFIVLFFAVIGFLLFKYYPTVIVSNYPLFISILNPLNIVLGVTAGLNLVMIGGSYAVRRLIERVTKRHIIKK